MRERELHKVSIIIPVLNGAHHIANTFKFLSEQKFTDFEVIFVVDVKTTDDTLELIKENTPSGMDVTVLPQSGEGKLGEARNIGLDHSTGDIIWFLDVDDRPFADFLSDLIRIMDGYNADVVMCNYLRSKYLDSTDDEEGESIREMDSRTAIDARLNEKIPVTAWSRITTRKLLIDSNLRFNHNFSEDIEHTFRLLMAAKKICYYEKPLYIYYQNERSVYGASGRDNIRGESEVKAYDDLEAFFADTDLSEKFNRLSSYTRIRSAVHMERKCFVKYARSERCKDMIKRNIPKWNWEIYLFKASPSLYYFMVKTFLDFIFYREGRQYR